MMSKKLAIALNEKDVENEYRLEFRKKFKDMEITSPFGCDGFGTSEISKVRVLMEFKDDLNLSNKSELVKVLAQSVFYIKRFYDKDIKAPTTIFIADRNECLALHVNDVIKYLDMDLDWSIAPSSAHNIQTLVLSLMKDESINPFVYKADHLDDCFETIKNLTDNVKRKVILYDGNICKGFNYFDTKVLGKNTFTTNEKANLFIQCLVNKSEHYLVGSEKIKKIHTKSFGQVPVISREAFTSFFELFSSSYTPSQKHKLASIVDRIVEDTTRRKQGEFFTPEDWVKTADEYISRVFGEDWKDRYVVWDPAWGTGNLTRDFQFKELYCSTLIQADIDTAKQMGYNQGSEIFPFDFLNDDYQKLPVGLKNAIENGREMIIFMNPPYATAGIFNDTHKAGTAQTTINKEMVLEGWGRCSENLYAQFLYRIYKFNQISGKIKIAVFCPPLFMSGVSYKSFREKFFQVYEFKKGFLFEASNFSDVADGWGISFSIFDNASNTQKFILDVLEDKGLEYGITKVSEKEIYNTDETLSLKDWVKKETVKCKLKDSPQLSSPLKIKSKGSCKLPEDAIGYLFNKSNYVEKNKTEVSLFSGAFSDAHGIAITPKNLKKIFLLFTSRKSVLGTWIDSKDEYLVPNTNNEVFEQFEIDSVVYSLFNNSSNQSSLRQVEYKNQLWDIKNEFFWMSSKRMKELADRNGYDELYNDARISSDRLVYKLLFGEDGLYDKLSPDAKVVLDKATELVENSIELRQARADEENHLNSWDAGYAQLKLVWKEYFQEDFKEFRQLYKNLEDRMRPVVYELGFLKK